MSHFIVLQARQPDHEFRNEERLRQGRAEERPVSPHSDIHTGRKSIPTDPALNLESRYAY